MRILIPRDDASVRWPAGSRQFDRRLNPPRLSEELAEASRAERRAVGLLCGLGMVGAPGTCRNGTRHPTAERIRPAVCRQHSQAPMRQSFSESIDSSLGHAAPRVLEDAPDDPRIVDRGGYEHRSLAVGALQGIALLE